MKNKVLEQTEFWIVNKAIAKMLKCNDSALLLSDLVDKHKYYEELNQLEDGFFQYTSEEIEKNLNISYKVQKRCIKLLVQYGLIETKLKGLPAKVNFKLLFEI
jgi:ribosome biogenesis SPOUT family RNA methylase Rps3